MIREESTEDLLRRALETQASQVGVDPDALTVIRAKVRRRRWWHVYRGVVMPFTLAGAVATTVAAVMFAGVSCSPAQPEPQPPATNSASPTAHPSQSGSPFQPSLPVYYIGSVNGKPLLYREFHQLSIADGTKAAQVRAALSASFDGRTAFDPDYASAWPADAAVRDVRVEGDVVTVDIGAVTINAGDPPTEKAALQQLIWTATAASGASGVRLLIEGRQADKLWGIPVGGTLHRGAAIDVLAPVWVIDPQQDSVYPAGVIKMRFAGVVWEAAMRVRIRDAGGKVVFDEHVQLDVGSPSQGTAMLTSPALRPGKYTVEGYYVSVKDSSEQAVDSHTFTVR